MKKVLVSLMLLALPYASLKAQYKPELPDVKIGVGYNLFTTGDFTKGTFGIETLLEKEFNKRISAEYDVGLYAEIGTQNTIYSKLRSNIGLKYKIIANKNESLGGKISLGGTSQVYRIISIRETPFEDRYINKTLTFDFEKKYKRGRKINFSLSREIDRNVWIGSIKTSLKNKR